MTNLTWRGPFKWDFANIQFASVLTSDCVPHEAVIQYKTRCHDRHGNPAMSHMNPAFGETTQDVELDVGETTAYPQTVFQHIYPPEQPVSLTDASLGPRTFRLTSLKWTAFKMLKRLRALSSFATRTNLSSCSGLC